MPLYFPFNIKDYEKDSVEADFNIKRDYEKDSVEADFNVKRDYDSLKNFVFYNIGQEPIAPIWIVFKEADD